MIVVLVAVALAALAAVVAAHYYLWRRLVRDTTKGRRARVIGTAALAVLTTLMVVTLIGSRVLPRADETPIAWPGFIWLALLFYLLLILAALEIPASIARRKITDPSRRLLLARTVAITTGVAAAGIVGDGMVNALGPPQLKRIQIPLAKLPRSADLTRIAVVSDIHLGPLRGYSHTRRIVDMINDLDADIVAIVGDLVDGSVKDLGEAASPLKDLRSRYGSYFVTGNHEYFSGFQAWVDEVASFGVTPLRNELVTLPFGLDLSGVNDATGTGYGDGPDYAKAMVGHDPARPSILLAHQPVQAHEAAKHGVDLQLSGHTHGGQMVPFNLVVRASGQPVVSGLGTVDGMPVYVTNGAGFWGPPVRVGAPPDITLVQLRAQ
jgi:predicted MPP superfamily phosphohydrolase